MDTKTLNIDYMRIRISAVATYTGEGADTEADGGYTVEIRSCADLDEAISERSAVLADHIGENIRISIDRDDAYIRIYDDRSGLDLVVIDLHSQDTLNSAKSVGVYVPKQIQMHAQCADRISIELANDLNAYNIRISDDGWHDGLIAEWPANCFN